MFIEDLIKEYPKEIKALEIDVDGNFNFYEISELVARCEAYRERKMLLARIEMLEERVNKLEWLEDHKNS